MLDHDEVKELEMLDKVGTRGPWRVGVYNEQYTVFEPGGDGDVAIGIREVADAEFIVRVKNNWQEILQYLKEKVKK